MYQFSPAALAARPSYGLVLMKKPKHGPPGPLGRLIMRRRSELGIPSQTALSDLTADHGLRVSQNTISRIESGATQTMHPEHLEVIAKALDLEANEDFILAVYGRGVRRSPSTKEDPSGALVVPASQPELQELVRVASQLDQKRDVPLITRTSRAMFDIPADEDGAQSWDPRADLIRVMQVTHNLSEDETASLRQFVQHVAETPHAKGPPAEERIATYARHLVASRGSASTQVRNG